MTSCVSPQKSRAPSKRLRSVSDLVADNLISALHLADFEKLSAHYDIGISAHIRDVLRGVSNPERDPVGRQYIPTLAELNVMPDEENDPIGDDLYSPVNGIVHRYPDRVLFKVTNVCAVYCRYCFRREMIGAGSDHLSADDFDAGIDYIKAHSDIWEVILTGGDPLVLSPRRLQKIIAALGEIEHVQSIRIHTRVPIANPSKIDDTILSVLKSVDQGIHMVVHVNHPKEITEEVKAAILRLRGANCSIYAQSVLLKDVNDEADILERLFRALIAMHVKPYYLHHLDRAKGTSHFRVPLEKGQAIMKELQGRVSGLCLPKYMIDIPGGHGKIPAYQDYVTFISPHLYGVEDYQGCEHLYFDRQVDAAEDGA
tara:strand:- start:14365 stop:15474 length:1110 start_codon:yes stop_codon:yes gene_type:complete